jgi:hypothetical protein
MWATHLPNMEPRCYNLPSLKLMTPSSRSRHAMLLDHIALQPGFDSIYTIQRNQKSYLCYHPKGLVNLVPKITYKAQFQ